jgi:hypothetical protein
VALYAFDGTWNSDKKGAERDTNVVWFRNAYLGRVEYQKGVGTRLGRAGKVAGGISGAGGRGARYDSSACGTPSRRLACRAARGTSGGISPPPGYAKLPGGRRIVRWNDQVHASVSVRTGAKHNNPPTGIVRVDDSGKAIGKLAVPADSRRRKRRSRRG